MKTCYAEKQYLTKTQIKPIAKEDINLQKKTPVTYDFIKEQFKPTEIYNNGGWLVKFTRNKADTSGPTSSIGIMQFFDSDSKSPQLDPKLIVGLSIVFMVLILVLKMMGK